MRRNQWGTPLTEAYMSLTPVGPYYEENNRPTPRGRTVPTRAFCHDCGAPCKVWCDRYCQTCARRIVEESR